MTTSLRVQSKQETGFERRRINMGRDKFVHTETVEWLLQTDSPGIRYLALRDLVVLEEQQDDLIAARFQAHKLGPIANILDAMQPEGYWVDPVAGYYPKYRGSVWSLILLAQLGARIECDERIGRAVDYLLGHSLTENGQFTISGAPSTTVDCLQGNLCAALVDLGCSDPRLDWAYDWMARSVTGEGVAPNTKRQAERRDYAGNCGPEFACGSNNKLPCAWGAVKVMLAFSKLPIENRTSLIEKAIDQGVAFLFSCDPAEAKYPNGWAKNPSGNWWKFGFPVFYVSDLLQNVEALVGLGFGSDPRLYRSLEIIQNKADDLGRWPLEYRYAGKTWLDFGEKKAPNKWVSLRALRVLSSVQN
jgi:hypothetical protein